LTTKNGHVKVSLENVSRYWTLQHQVVAAIVLTHTTYFLSQDERVQVASLIKATHMYRLKKHHDIVLDYLPPTEDEIKTFHNSHIRYLFTPAVQLATLEYVPQVQNRC
jgi:hypothetical protein